MLFFIVNLANCYIYQSTLDDVHIQLDRMKEYLKYLNSVYLFIYSGIILHVI